MTEPTTLSSKHLCARARAPAHMLLVSRILWIHFTCVARNAHYEQRKATESNARCWPLLHAARTVTTLCICICSCNCA